MGRCQVCGDKASTISRGIGVCLQCIREKPEKSLSITGHAHAESRRIFDLPAEPPYSSDGIFCGICSNNCRIGFNEKGFCGLVLNINGRITRKGGIPERGVLEWYYDPLPTNCVAWWFCPGCTGKGYPKYAYKQSAETGYANLAVFYGACSLDCLFCQNWQYRRMSQTLASVVDAKNLAEKADSHVSCICYFGGDPSVQMPHALRTSELALEKAAIEKRILRICWETNGNIRREFAEKAAEQSFHSGGVVKFDLKAFDYNIYKALCGVSYKSAFDNFRMIGEKYFSDRLEVPILTASTLLIPGYVDEKEVEDIARFIADINPRIPYTLLAFYPQYKMNDLPSTGRTQAMKCREAAKNHLENVRIGSIHLLS